MYKLKQIPEDFVVKEKLTITKSSGNYYYFFMQKTELTTEIAIGKITRILKIPRKNISYAGNKDKNAITTQTISIRSHKNLENFELNQDNLNLKFLGKGNTPISLGSLNKNRFEITVRNITKKPSKITTFSNYFDKQRFSKNNAEIGKLIIKKEFKKAAKLLEKNHYSVKEYLQKKSTDFVGAIRKLPVKIIMIYLHSYQSLLFNELLNNHIKKYKHKTIKTDFGELSFPLEEIKQIKFSLIGFETKETSEVIEILKKENITRRDFIIRQLPNLSQSGQLRQGFRQISDLKISNLKDDELNKNKKKIKLTFSLSKGSYATMVVKALFL
ncbi:tRNA pseudouridine(13) synthase TruD [Candidatus Woesearchaeota archaeon]|nr:tRNA pseudouridine(13) synthase TruD [Candidatus Woesearchaeota archaeon]